jgi:broad specificity phosphatase PhoE
MIIGLVRHFPVNFKFAKLSNSDTFNQNMESYDSEDIISIATDHDFKQWDHCFTSTMKRALATSKIIGTNSCVQTDLLREVPLTAGFKIGFKIPVFMWALIARLQWLFKTGPQPENRKMSLARARKFIQQHCLSASPSARILVITHGFFMTCLRWELRKLGFSGPLLIHVKNGKLYTFEKRVILKKI